LSKIFYERFIQDGEITLFSPHDVPGLYDAFGLPEFDSLYIEYENNLSIPKKTIKAQDLILTLLKERAETGRIYIMNIDHCNSHSSFKDQITMSNLCVAGDTKIKIKYFIKDIDDYRWATIDIKNLNDFTNNPNYRDLRVLSYDLNNEMNATKPISAFRQTSPKAKVMKITDEESGKSIVVTPEHKVFTKNRGYVVAKDLVETDELVLTSNEKTSTLIIEYLEEKIPVYDITVEGTHNFFANDILVHNCQEITLPTVPLQHIDQKPNTLKMKVKIKKDKVEDYKKYVQNTGGVLYDHE
jgi:ribonucleotide reductase alpha subunit